ncbi:acyl-CoA dehydrogenase family protein [Metabacillus sp. GX 13764]|uniref:acyl-CoA dehydrogenase family protein n=1 Tax=Metabacillus kandeliae TaxID=2900151 RepID=UPI001E53DEC7|nr:acyl-CoA dehydrogenase family protein [Metabacillus kandeliae]MCD7032698.1 acyl-CoA dehydrogenase family protein [Metabacillus kandeliae]
MRTAALSVKGGSFLYERAGYENIFTPEDFTGEHKMIAETAKQFLTKEVDPHHEEIEQQDFSRIVLLLKKAGDLGLLAHSIPEAYGGLGLDKISKGLVGEVIGRSSGYGVAHSNHTCIATLPITYFGTKEQKEKYLPKLASGEYIGAYCLTEPNSGSDALAAQTTAVLNEAGTHYVLNGTKLYITNAAFSDTFIIYAKVNGEHFTAFIAEKDFPGLSLGPEEQKMGIKGSSTRSVILEDCLIPKENLLGDIGKGHVIALNVLNLGRFNLGSACMGASKYAFRLAVGFTKERRQFNRAIADFAATKEKTAKMAARIFASESMQYRTAGLLEDALGDLYSEEDHALIGKRMMEYAAECAICKVYGSETLDMAADESLQLHGGAGFIKEYKIEQVYRDSRINRIFEGTNEINRLLLPTLFYRKAGKGDIPLEQLVQKASETLKSPLASEDGVLGREEAAIETLRNVLLVSFGAAWKQFGKGVVEEQETIMKLSDMAILLYAAESCLFRTKKAIQKNGAENEKLKVLLTEAAVEEALLQSEFLVRKIISGIAAGEQRMEWLQLIRGAFLPFSYENTVERNRAIAAAQQDKEQYIC